MTSTSAEQMSYQLAGQAVAAAQMFEAIFVIAARLAIKQSHATTLEDIVPLSQSKSFKQPIKAILQELSKSQAIAPGLEDRIGKLIEDRHRIVHRAVFEFGWPQNQDRAAEFSELCSHVASESGDLAMLFYKLILAWMQKFPETAPTVRQHEADFGVTQEQVREAVALISGA